MRERVQLAVALLVVAVAGLAIWVVLHDREPVYQCRALSDWLRTYDPSAPFGRGSAQWKETDKAVRQIGTNSIPFLLRMLSAKDSKLKLEVMALARRQHVVRIHFMPASVRNVEASRAFIALGDTAKGAVPGLMRIYTESNSVESMNAAEEALGWIGPGARPAIPLLLGAATNSNNRVKASALWALGEIHAEHDLCVPSLIHALGDSDDWVRLSAAHALGAFRADAQSAVPALKELASLPAVPGKFSATRIQVRLEAKNALQKINPGAVSLSDEKIPGFDPVFPAQ